MVQCLSDLLFLLMVNVAALEAAPTGSSDLPGTGERHPGFGIFNFLVDNLWNAAKTVFSRVKRWKLGILSFEFNLVHR